MTTGDGTIKNIESKVYELLMKIGTNPSHLGYTYLKIILTERLKSELSCSSKDAMEDYRLIKKLSKERYNIDTTCSQIERCIRFEIKTILGCKLPAAVEAKNKVFGGNVPHMTNRQFIAYLHEYLMLN